MSEITRHLCTTHPDVHLVCPRCRAIRVGRMGGARATPAQALAAKGNATKPRPNAQGKNNWRNRGKA